MRNSQGSLPLLRRRLNRTQWTSPPLAVPGSEEEGPLYSKGMTFTLRERGSTGKARAIPGKVSCLLGGEAKKKGPLPFLTLRSEKKNRRAPMPLESDEWAVGPGKKKSPSMALRL